MQNELFQKRQRNLPSNSSPAYPKDLFREIIDQIININFLRRIPSLILNTLLAPGMDFPPILDPIAIFISNVDI